jgi:hypothetical protein
MSEHPVAPFEPARRRVPSTLHAALQHLIGIGRVIERSDRSDCAESGGIEDQIDFRRNPQDHVERELVLSYDLNNLGGRLFVDRPQEEFSKGSQTFDFFDNLISHQQSRLTQMGATSDRSFATCCSQV